jgi:hypothetical protein
MMAELIFKACLSRFAGCLPEITMTMDFSRNYAIADPKCLQMKSLETKEILG